MQRQDINSFVHRLPLAASAQPLVALKDSIDVAGMPTQLGSLACSDAPPATQDAMVTQRLKQHGFSVCGKTVMHELAFGMTGVNRAFGTPMNPLYPHLIPGGSSSGSATAVAGNQVDVAIGTDTGGSVRLPAACCGIYGLKPTFARVSRQGVWPADTSLDCVGVFARTPDMITHTMHALCDDFNASYDKADVASQDSLKIGWVKVTAHDDIINKCLQALSQCDFVELVPQVLPELESAFQAGLTLINRETWLACQPYYATGKLGSDVAERLERASHTTDEAVVDAENMRVKFTEQVDNALESTRVIALPTLPHFPMTLEQALAGVTDVTISKLVRPFNLSGHPAISMPYVSATGLPVGLQLVGRKGDDAYLCAISERIAKSLQ